MPQLSSLLSQVFIYTIPVSKDALVSFAEKINWSLCSDEVLISALTHKSYVMSENDNALGIKTYPLSFNHNERLVYLGKLFHYLFLYLVV